MKHLKTFENYSSYEVTNEFNLGKIAGGVRKFTTGHESGDAKATAKAKIESDIEEHLQKLEGSWPPEKIEKKRVFMLKAAADNNWRGYVKNGRYQEIWSDLEELGAAAAGAHSGFSQNKPS